VLTFGDTDVRVEAIVALLGAVRRIASIDHDIAAEMLASTAELRSLAEWHLAGKPASDETPELLVDWRNELIGKLLAETLAGNVAVRVEVSSASGLEVRALSR
jgi:ribonuclease D